MPVFYVKAVGNYSRAYQQEKFEATIKKLFNGVVVSPDGKQINMLDIAMSSLKGRFNRLWCWTKGMEEYATKQDHVCAMYTVSLSSKRHPVSGKYDGTSIAEGQKILATSVWGRANARFKKHGIYPYGCRVSQPHKRDGTVHWHVFVFASYDDLLKIDEILKDLAFRENGTELGAKKHRYDFKFIGKAEGGAKASSYIFRYILGALGSLALKGYTSGDLDKILAEKMSAEEVWAKTYDIRQVQFVGGASVGVWDELRRLEDELDDQHLEAMRLACNDNDFCKYYELQGGHKMGKRSHYAKMKYDAVMVVNEKLDTATGEVVEDIKESVNAYGEPIMETIGIEYGEKFAHSVVNRRAKWSIEWGDGSSDGVSQDVRVVEDFSLVPVGLVGTSSFVVRASSDALEAYETHVGWV